MRFLRAGLLLTALVFVPGVSAQQDWKPAAIASFDDVWQTIADSFYDPTFGGLDWAALKTELRPKAEAAGSPDDVRRIITDMLARLKRSHFVLLSAPAESDIAPAGDAVVPIDIRPNGSDFVITYVEPQSTAELAGLRAGQTILSIDGRLVSAITAAAAGADPQRRAYDAWRRVFLALHGVRGSTAALRVRKPDRTELDTTVVRGEESGSPVTIGNLPPLHVRTDVRDVKSPSGRRVGVIAFNLWMPAINAALDPAIDRFRHADGLVIDLRGNPGGLAEMMRGLAGHVLNEPLTLGRMQTRQSAMPLEFKANPRRSTADGRRVEPYAGPVAILVDELTASTSECFAGGLQSLGRARVFGRRTMGQALPSVTKRLANGDVLLYAIGDFVTSTGRRLEGEGIVPDETLPLSIDALAAGRDAALEAALKWIDGRRSF